MQRTHTCGEPRKDLVGQEVTLCGWVDSYRDHGGLQFIDLRDRYGKTQIVFGPESGEQLQTLASELRSEFVVKVSGKVAARSEATINPKLDTGRKDRLSMTLRLITSNKNRLLNKCWQSRLYSQSKLPMPR